MHCIFYYSSANVEYTVERLGNTKCKVIVISALFYLVDLKFKNPLYLKKKDISILIIYLKSMSKRNNIFNFSYVPVEVPDKTTIHVSLIF